MDHERARNVVHELNRKLLLLKAERKAAKRGEIIDSIFDTELKELKDLLELEE